MIDFASSGKVHPETAAYGGDRPRVFPGLAFEAAQFVLAVLQSRCARASGGAAEDRPRGRRGEGGVLQ